VCRYDFCIDNFQTVIVKCLFMPLKVFRIFFILLFFARTAATQPLFSGGKSIDKNISSLAYRKVLSEGGRLAEKKNNDPRAKTELLKKMAAAAYAIKEYRVAESYYRTIFEVQSSYSDSFELLPKYAHVLAALGKNEEAAQVWEKYSDLNVSEATVSSDFAILQKDLTPLKRNQGSYLVKYLPINSGLSEFSPVRWGSGLVFVASRPVSGAVKRVFEWDETPFLDLFFLQDISELSKTSSDLGRRASKNSRLGSDYYSSETANDASKLSYNSGILTAEHADLNAKEFDSGLNSIYHEGPCDFFNEGKSIIFTRNGVRGFNYDAADGINRIHLYVADYEAGNWKNLRAFPFNDGNYSTGHPAFNADESILFFVSDMPGGFGGTDLYYSRYKDGRWQNPVNAGPKINTSGHEMFPYIDELNNLYFASDGHPGMGGLDIFTVPLNANGVPELNVANLGAPINSGWDDFGLIADANFKSGYFSSNRKNGGADDDIYSFERTGEKFGCKEIEIAVKDSESQKPLAGIEFEWYEAGKPSKRNRIKLDDEGRTALCLKADSEFYIEFKSEGYQVTKKYLSTKGLHDFKSTFFEILLVRNISEPEKEEETYPLSRMMSRIKEETSPEIYSGIILDSDKKPLGGVQVRFINRCSDQVLEQTTGKDGRYKFPRIPDCDYEFIAVRPGFSTNYEFVDRFNSGLTAGAGSKNVSPIDAEELVDKTEIKLPAVVKSKESASVSYFDPKYFKVGDVIRMENIYYNDLETGVTTSARNDLNQVAKALEDYPDMVIDVISHTDSRGDARENMKISQKRADEIKFYLANQGIDLSRIRAIGMGENSPVNGCIDGVKCTEAEYRRNRRTEFRILRIEKL
jgi:outer membrane protein OmpA-like peptidoglycan-associated protein/tetratricopeptide (TPR) repeat protein